MNSFGCKNYISWLLQLLYGTAQLPDNECSHITCTLHASDMHVTS